MNIMHRGFLWFLLGWVVAGSALYLFFYGRFSPLGALLGAIGGGLFVAVGLGAFRSILQIRDRIGLLNRSKAGVMPEEGKPFVAVGRITSTGVPVSTPFHNKECVSFTYSIYERITVTTREGSSVSTQQRRKNHMGGFAFGPCAVHSNIAEIKILGFPLPDDFPEDGFSAKGCRDKVLGYIRRAQVPIARALPLRQLLIKSRELFSEGETIHRQDWRDGKLESLLNSPSTFVAERSIPVDAQVCVFGIYSSAKRGLLPDRGLGGMEVIRGTADDGIREFRRRDLVSMIIAICCLGIGTFGMYMFLLSLHEP